MSNPLKILIEFSHPRGTVKEVEVHGEKWILHGECNRCGVCCEQAKMPVKEYRTKSGGCNKLSYEMVDSERLAKCSVMWCRPAWCIFYPRDPYEELPKECSFKWEKF